MSDKHPGPWRFVDASPTTAIVDANGNDVCCWDVRDRGEPPMQAPHGHLMARAPTLLAERHALQAACRTALDYSRDGGNRAGVLRQLRDALALCKEHDVKETKT